MYDYVCMIHFDTTTGLGRSRREVPRRSRIQRRFFSRVPAEAFKVPPMSSKVDGAEHEEYERRLVFCVSASGSFSAASTPIFASKCSLATRCCAKEDELVLRC